MLSSQYMVYSVQRYGSGSGFKSRCRVLVPGPVRSFPPRISPDPYPDSCPDPAPDPDADTIRTNTPLYNSNSLSFVPTPYIEKTVVNRY